MLEDAFTEGLLQIEAVDLDLLKEPYKLLVEVLCGVFGGCCGLEVGTEGEQGLEEVGPCARTIHHLGGLEV